MGGLPAGMDALTSGRVGWGQAAAGTANKACAAPNAHIPNTMLTAAPLCPTLPA